MKRGRANPAAYSSTEKPAGTLIRAPAGRGTMVGAFGFGGACASIMAASAARARNVFMAYGLHSTRLGRKEVNRAAVRTQKPAIRRLVRVWSCPPLVFPG